MKAPGGRPPRVILSDFSDFLAKRWDPANAAGSVQGTPTGRAWVGRRNGSSSAMPVASPICWKPSERPTIRLIRTASQSCPSRRRRRSLGRPDEKPGARPGVSPARGAGAPADQGRMQEGVSRDGRRRQDRPQPAAQALDQLDAGDVLMVSNSKFRFRGYFRSFVSLSGWVLGGTGEARGQGGRSAAAAMDCSRWGQSRKTT